MNDAIRLPTKQNAQDVERKRDKRNIIVGCTACIVAFMAFWALIFKPVWPMAIGVVAIAAMVTAICYAVLRRPV
jgi:CHASE2 domain-containing sensor protein